MSAISRASWAREPSMTASATLWPFFERGVAATRASYRGVVVGAAELPCAAFGRVRAWRAACTRGGCRGSERLLPLRPFVARHGAFASRRMDRRTRRCASSLLARVAAARRSRATGRCGRRALLYRESLRSAALGGAGALGGVSATRVVSPPTSGRSAYCAGMPAARMPALHDPNFACTVPNDGSGRCRASSRGTGALRPVACSRRLRGSLATSAP